MNHTVILASASPRRRELFKLITKDFEVIPSNAEETTDFSLPPSEVVMRLAEQKARDVGAANPGRVVVGCDTIVVIDKEILGKPADEKEAEKMLSRLQGKTHQVFTGSCLTYFDGNAWKERCFYEETKVTFYPLTAPEIAAYIATGEPMDKAGAYGIQEAGSLLVQKIDGDYFTVVGLSLGRLKRELDEFVREVENADATGA